MVENLINEMWGTEGYQFTIALEVVDADQVHHLIGMCKRGTLVAGCKIVRLHAHDMTDVSQRQAERLSRLLGAVQTEVDEIIQDSPVSPVLSLE